MGNLEHVKGESIKMVSSVTLFIRYWVWGPFTFPPLPGQHHPLSPGRVVSPFCSCARLDLLNNRCPSCLLLLLLCIHWMCTVKRGGHYPSAYSTAKSPGEPWFVWLCHSAGFLLSSATFLFPLLHFRDCTWLVPVRICAEWSASQFTGALASLTHWRTSCPKTSECLSVCSSNTKWPRRHIASRHLFSS